MQLDPPHKFLLSCISQRPDDPAHVPSGILFFVSVLSPCWAFAPLVKDESSLHPKLFGTFESEHLVYVSERVV